MASCITSKWGSKGTSPQIKLTVTLDSSASDGDTAVLDWKLQYIADYAVSSSVSKSYTVKINGSSVKTGTYSIGGKTGTHTIASGSKSVAKGTSAKSISFSCSMDIEITWNDVYKGTISASGSISVPAKTKYTVSYNANGGSGAPSAQTKWYGTTLTLSSTKPTRSGYTFVGWGTSATDTSANYSAGGSYTANASDTLYAIWKKTIKLTYNANGGSGAPSAQSATVYNSTTSNKFTLSSTKPARTGYTFLGWSTSSSATSAGYSAGGSITLSTNDTLYAVWSENALTVNYYSNYATYAAFKGEEVSVSASTDILVHTQKFYYDNSCSDGLANVQNVNYLYLSRTGYAPTGYWGTSSSGGTLVNQSTSFPTGQALAQALGKSLASENASVNVYPQWSENAYVLTYDSNGGFGEMSPQTIEWGELFSLSNNTFKRVGYKFVGWNAYRNDDNTWYVNGQGWITEDEIIANGYSKKLYENQCELTFDTSWIRDNEEARLYTMYAVWELFGGIVYIDNGITFEPYLPYIDNGVGWDVYLAYVDDGTSWKTLS